MNPNLRKYIDALKSGEYTQCDGNLKNGSSFCALGVLADIYAQEHDNAKWIDDIYTIKLDYFDPNGYTTGVPPEVSDWAGLDHEIAEDIMYLNDDAHYDFTRIADELEKIYVHD